MLKGEFHFAHDASAFCSCAPRRAQRVELEAVEASRVNVHDGVIRARVQQEHGWLAVHCGIEQGHAVDGLEENYEGSALLRERCRREKGHAKKKRAINVQ